MCVCVCVCACVCVCMCECVHGECVCVCVCMCECECVPHFLNPGLSVGNWMEFLIRTVKLDASILGPEDLRCRGNPYDFSSQQSDLVLVRVRTLRSCSPPAWDTSHRSHICPPVCHTALWWVHTHLSTQSQPDNHCPQYK